MQNTVTTSEKINAFVGGILRTTCIGCFVAISILMVFNVFARFFPILSLSWFDEVVEGMFAWLVFLGAAALWRENEHFTVTFLPDCLRGSKKGCLLEVTISLISILFLAVFTYYSLVLTLKAGDTTPVLQMPKRLLYSCMPLSGAIMIAHSLQKMLTGLCRLGTPERSA